MTPDAERVLVDFFTQLTVEKRASLRIINEILNNSLITALTNRYINGLM